MGGWSQLISTSDRVAKRNSAWFLALQNKGDIAANWRNSGIYCMALILRVGPPGKPHPPMNSNDDTSNTQEHCISICNGLLRSELSAIETYGQAIEKYAGAPVTDELRRIRSEHGRSANRLSANVRGMGGEPERDSGAWGIFATAMQAAANLFGRESAIESLQRGEEAGRADYHAALLDDEVMIECKQMIREDLLPPVMEHINSLEKLEHAA